MTDEERAVIKRRAERINALTPEQASAALHYLSGYTPEGIDLCLARHEAPGHMLQGAFDALREADPDGAADAVFALIEGDALAKIRARILEEGEPVPEAAKAARIRKLIAEGQVLGIIEPDPADAAPDTAQPEDIPAPACRRCGATDTPLLIGGTCNNSALCAERQAAKAGAVNG